MSDWLNSVGSRRATGARSRQGADFESAARRLLAVMQSADVTPKQLQDAINAFVAAANQVDERIRARETVLNNLWLDGSARDASFAREAGSAVDLVDRSSERRMQMLAAVAGFIEAGNEAELNNAIQTYSNALEDAVALTNSAESAVQNALNRLQTLGVQVPAVLYITGSVAPQPDGTQVAQVFIRNEGGAVSQQANLQIQVSGGFDLVSASASAVPPLAPGAEFTFPVVVRAVPTRGSTGLLSVGVQGDTISSPGWIPLSTADVLPPQVVVQSPAPGETMRATQPLIAVRIIDSGGINPNSLQMQVDGQAVNPTYDPTTATLHFQPAQPLASGERRVQVSASDLAGKRASAGWTFTVNPDAPAEILDLQVAPNPFSPNGDGIDDLVTATFRLTGEALPRCWCSTARDRWCAPCVRWRPCEPNLSRWYGMATMTPISPCLPGGTLCGCTSPPRARKPNKQWRLPCKWCVETSPSRASRSRVTASRSGGRE